MKSNFFYWKIIFVTNNIFASNLPWASQDLEAPSPEPQADEENNNKWTGLIIAFVLILIFAGLPILKICSGGRRRNRGGVTEDKNQVTRSSSGTGGTHIEALSSDRIKKYGSIDIETPVPPLVD